MQVHVLQDRLQLGFRQHEHLLVHGAQAFAAHADLLQRFLAGDVQRT